MEEPSRAELEAAHSWEPGDRVPGRPDMTAFRRRIRLQQARWRETQGYPIGTQPIGQVDGRAVGSRLPLAFARQTGANFLTPAARAAAFARLDAKEPHQSVDAQRMLAELLWSPALAVNLFGDLSADRARADRAVHTWWPDAPGAVEGVRFAYSPGWLDRAFLGNLSSFDAAFHLTRGIVAIAVKYYDYAKREVAKPQNLPHYRRIAQRSGAFTRGAIDAINGSGLTVMWLQHLLVLSMLQHPSEQWRWGRLVVVHAAGNTDYADACAQYREFLTEPSTFASMTLDELVGAGALARRTAAAVRRRYL